MEEQNTGQDETEVPAGATPASDVTPPGTEPVEEPNPVTTEEIQERHREENAEGLIPSHEEEIHPVEGDEDPPEVEINPTDGEHDDFAGDGEMRPPEGLLEESQRADLTDDRAHSDDQKDDA